MQEAKDNSQGYSNNFYSIDDVPLERALLPEQDAAGRISQYQVTQRNFDTRSGNITLRDDNNVARLLIGQQQGGF